MCLQAVQRGSWRESGTRSAANSTRCKRPSRRSKTIGSSSSKSPSRFAPGQKSCCVARWGGPKLTSILPAELRGALIADSKGDACRVARLGDQQLTGFQQADLLLILDWAHGRRRPEVTMKRSVAHVGELGQMPDPDRLMIMRPDPGDRAANLRQAAIGAGELAELRALRAL